MMMLFMMMMMMMMMTAVMAMMMMMKDTTMMMVGLDGSWPLAKMASCIRGAGVYVLGASRPWVPPGHEHHHLRPWGVRPNLPLAWRDEDENDDADDHA
eukprot:1776734-Karenia_brevis.AAC.1